MLRGIRKTQPQATNKQTNRRKPNRRWHNSKDKCRRRWRGEGGEGRGVGSTHLDKLNVFKNGSIFRSSPSSQDVDVPASSSSVSLQGQLCAALLHFSSCPLSPVPSPFLCQHLAVLFFVSLSSQRVKSELDFSPTCWPYNISGHTQVAISHQSCNSTPPPFPLTLHTVGKLTC